MILTHPTWLILALPLAATLWVWPPRSRLLFAMRVVLLLCVGLALCGAALRLPSRGGTVVVIADRSRSMPADSDGVEKEIIDLLQGSMGTDDRLGVVAFGETTAVEATAQSSKFPGFIHEVGGDASNLADGLETALALVPDGAPGRLIVLSDGRWTGRDPSPVAVRAAARGIAIDYRSLRRSSANDLAVARVDAPASVGPGESFLITAWVHAPVARQATYELRRGDVVLATGKRELVAGLNRLTFRDRATDSGSQGYTLNITGGTDDPVPENNTARILVGVQGQRPLLHVTRSPNSALAKLLERGGLSIKVKAPEACEWSLEELSKFAGVILENVPADQIGGRGMEILAAWVRDTGSGLMLTGGRDSYGPGGYYRSPLEPILPVTLELRQEHRKLALAIVVALDRSGSMAVPAGGGKVKMDLANLGTVAVLDLLSAEDELGVIAVDTAPHTIAELGPVTNKERIRREVLRIRSEGGGIYVDEALMASIKMILKAKAGTRHIVLFADAADAEQGGDYKNLVDKCSKAGITISVIGLGTSADKDAELLKDIASRGKGRIFFSDRAEDLPRLFAQDTFVLARNTFLDEPTPAQSVAGLVGLTGRPFHLTKPLGGYNLCYLRPEATLGVVTLDEYKAPVVAAWQAGVGRVLCYTGEADGKYAGAMAGWSDVGEFYTSLARWVAGPGGALPDNVLVTQEVRNGVHRVEVHLDPERTSDPFTGQPKVRTLHALPGSVPQSRQDTLRWTGPDTLTLETRLSNQATSLATVELPGQKPLALPPVCLPYSPEFRPAQGTEGARSLERLAAATGGKERIDLGEVWAAMPRQPRPFSLAPWLLAFCLPLVLLEVLERRTGLLSRWSRIVIARAAPKIAAMRAKVRKPRLAPAPRVVVPAATPEVVNQPVEAAPERDDMLDALRKARKRSRDRTEGA